MRVVVFSSNYPPLRNPRAFRVGRYYPILCELGETSLITAPVRGFTKAEPGVIRTGFRMSPFSPLRAKLKRTRLMRKLHACILPDDKVLYQIWYLIYYLLKCRQKGDLIITVSNPFSSHLIGAILKYFMGHPWIVDIGDVYSNVTNKNGISRLKRTFEDIVLRNVDHVIVNAHGLKKYYHECRGIAEDKISVIPNGVSTNLSMIVHQPSDTLRLSYIGNTYVGIREGIREIEVLLMAIQQQFNSKIRIQLYGTQFHDLETLAYQHPNWIKSGSCQSDFELADAYSKTDILINFANINYPGIPSKLEEYVSTGLPIINFFYSPAEASISYLNSVKCKVFHVNLKHPDLPRLHEFIHTIHPETQTRINSQPGQLKQYWYKLLTNLSLPS